VGGTRYARVVVADGLLALAGQLGVIQLHPGLDEGAQVGLYGRLVLGRRRDDAGIGDQAVRADLIPVAQGPPGGLGDAVADAGPRAYLDGGRVRRGVGGDEPQRLLDRVHRFDGPHDDAAERVVAGLPQPGGAGRLAGQRRQPPRVERVAGQRPGEVAAAAGQVRVQRGRVRHVLLDHVLVPGGRRERQARTGHQRALLDGVGARAGHRKHVRRASVIGKMEARHPAHGLERVVERSAQGLGERDELGRGGGPVEAADAHVDRVDGPAADRLHDRVPGLLQRQAALHEITPIRGHLDPAAVAEEVGGVQ